MILSGHIFSKQLQMDTGLSVLTATDYAGKPYKVCYLLHGLCGSNYNFIENSLLSLYAAKYPGVLFVMPSAVRSYYADMRYGQNYYGYVAKELPGIIGGMFNISKRPEDTSVMGASMGGYGALKIGLSSPGRYGYVCAMSPGCLFLKDFLAELRQGSDDAKYINEYGAQFINDYQAAYGENFDYDESNELLALAKKAGPALSKTKILTTCGRDDFLCGYNRAFAAEMKTAGADIVYEEADGGHDMEFFDKALKRCLEVVYGK